MAAKTIINKIANQKSGIDRPRKAKNEKALSAVVFFFAAEIIPAGTAIRRAIIKDINASNMLEVIGSCILQIYEEKVEKVY